MTKEFFEGGKEEFYDGVAEIKAKILALWAEPGQQAREASDAGTLKLVREQEVEPFDGYGFTLDKGQVLRYELTDGPQVIDCTYLVRERPVEEFADAWHTGIFGALTLHEGMHFISNTPYCRPLLTIIRDTVDYENLENLYGKGAAHSFIFPSGRCTEGLWELGYGIVNAHSCNSGILKGIVEVAGEEVARALRWPPGVFMHFQCLNYDKIPTTKTYYNGHGALKVGDYVELLAHQDLYVAFSLCPVGDQADYSAYENFTNWPLKYQIYEGADGPLETAPDPQMKSTEAVDWIMTGRPGLITGKVGKKE